MDGQWHFGVTPNMWFTGIKGEASVKGLPSVPVAQGAPVTGELDLEADVRQLFIEGYGFYRVASGGRTEDPPTST